MVSVDDVVDGASTKIVLINGEVMGIEQLLTIGTAILTRCHKCPIRDTCPAREQAEEAGYCIIEEGLIITATQDLHDDFGVDVKRDKYQIFSFVVNLLHLHRMARMGSRINYSYIDKDNMDIMNKYMAMLAKVDGRFHKAMEQLQATKKEIYKMDAEQDSKVSNFVDIMTKLAEKNKVGVLEEQHLAQLESAKKMRDKDNDRQEEMELQDS